MGNADRRFNLLHSMAALSLATWLLGVVGGYEIGRAVHLFLATAVILVIVSAFTEQSLGGIDVATLPLFAWILGVTGVYDVGRAVHVLLAIAVVLIVVAVLPPRARRLSDHTIRRHTPSATDTEV